MYSLDNVAKQLEEKIKENDFVFVDASFFFPRIFFLDEESQKLIGKVASVFEKNLLRQDKNKITISHIKELEKAYRVGLLDKEEFEKGICFLEEYDKIIDFLARSEKTYITENVKEELTNGIYWVRKRKKDLKNFLGFPKEIRKECINFRKTSAKKLKETLRKLEERIAKAPSDKNYLNYITISQQVPNEFSYTDKELVTIAFYEGIVQEKKCKILSFDSHLCLLFKKAYNNLLSYATTNYNYFSKQIKSARIDITSILPNGQIDIRENTVFISKKFFDDKKASSMSKTPELFDRY